MTYVFPQPFSRNYESLLKRLKLRGMQPKTIESYSHGVRRAGAHFEYQIDNLSKDQLTDYFSQVLDQLSWSTLKHDLYGLKFYYAYVLEKHWPGAELTKAPKVSRLPDIVTVEQMQQIVNATRILSYRVFFFALYSMGLRLGEGLQLQVGDIDQDRMRVHVRDAKATGIGWKAAARPHAERVARVLARASSSGAVIPQSPERPRRRIQCHDAHGSWRRAAGAAPGHRADRFKKELRRTAFAIPMPLI
ncbi:site-specific integrase [Ferrovum myxofaciens]|uniref:site-specific integrase n=1 Tax=Ferrovum myxofaciens TaxID=416213 RepID=UPI002353304C|nr:site-specific integrase [Ferrovum myxofaciens]MBU6995599.1 site-specific integrase [Ferrovum myxofaciens]